MKSKNFFLLSLCYLILLILLIIYSYTQIDLNLTLSANVFYQFFQQKLIYFGYYQRNFSATAYLLILAILYVFYLLVLKKAETGKVSLKYIKILIIFSSVLILAYPAFSHDFFNYMFDARIVTKYHLSPYFFKALDFPNDTWIRFMHWTHRYYPYGPGWLLITLFPSFIGFGKFVFTLVLFKLLFAVCYLINCRMIYSLVSSIDFKRAKTALVFYALNPLILIETLISPHNEVMMLTFLLGSLWLLKKQKNIWSIIFLIMSISIKYLSVVFLPLYVLIKTNFEKLIQLGFYLWLIALIPVVLTREIYVWYFIPIIGLAALLVRTRHIKIIALSISASTLVRYWSYLLNGDYGTQTIYLQNLAMVCLFVSTGILGIILWAKNQY